MLSSIHPLGERARHNRWWLTAAAFSISASAASVGLGVALGWLGSLLGLGGLPSRVGAPMAGVLVALAGLMDLAGPRPPGPRRQVNERWIGTFRGWVYGSGFGAQLGLGFVTFVVTWSVYAWMAVALLSAEVAVGALIGVSFGVGRSASLLAAGRVRRPSQLVTYTAAMARLARPARFGLALSMALGGFAAMVS